MHYSGFQTHLLKKESRKQYKGNTERALGPFLELEETLVHIHKKDKIP